MGDCQLVKFQHQTFHHKVRLIFLLPYAVENSHHITHSSSMKLHESGHSILEKRIPLLGYQSRKPNTFLRQNEGA